MKKQALRFGLETVEFEEVKTITPGKTIKVKTDSKEYESYSVIIASGSIPKKLNIPGEDKFMGKGVSYCVACDGPLFKDKEVAVIGCGNSGLQEGEVLMKYAKKVAFIEFLPEMPAQKILQERLRKEKKASFFLNYMTTAVKGDKMVTSISIKDRKTNEEKEIKVSGVFIYAGFLPSSGFAKGTVKMDERGYIITNEKMETSVKGIYAVGDVRSDQVRQIPTACGSAVTAMWSVEEYLKKIKG